jgi:sugar/nucleoside kinase (ribokinase family)
VLKRGGRGTTVFENGEETDVPVPRSRSSTGSVRATRSRRPSDRRCCTAPPLVDAVRRGSVAGAIVASRLACSEAMPYADELEAALV